MSKREFDYLGFGHRLRVARIVLGLTQAEMATAAGCTEKTWRKYEDTGEGNCTLPMLRVGEKFNISLDWIMDGDAGGIRDHLSRRAPGKVAILATKGRRLREAERRWRERGLGQDFPA